MTDPRNETMFAHFHLQLTGIISDKTMDMFNIVTFAGFGNLVGIFGLVSNSINIVVFLKQGFVDTTNVSLFALTMSDFMSVLTLQWISLLRNPLFYNSGVILIASDIYHLTGCYPHGLFVRMTSFITAFITLERCLCVLIPLKVKMVVTPKLTVSVLISIFLVLLLTLLPDNVTSYIGWKFDDTHNRSMLGLLYTAGRGEMTVLSFTLAAYTQMVSFLAVLLFTGILVIKMKEKSRWRTTTSNVGYDSQKRDIKIVNMVILIAAIFSVCSVPRIATYLATSVEPEFTNVGRYQNLFFVVWSFADLADSFNASVSIFIYYRMSSKYRITYHSLLKITVCCKLLRVMNSKEKPNKHSHILQMKSKNIVSTGNHH